MTYPIPPWLAQSADPAGQYATGLGIGVRIGAEQAAQQLAQQQLLRRDAENEFERQYKSQVLQMDIDRVMRQQQAERRFQDLRRQGVPAAEALMEVGPSMGEKISDLLNVQALNQQRAVSNRLAEARIAGTERSSDIREKELEARIQDINRKSERYTVSDADKIRASGLQKQIDELNKIRVGLDPEETGNKAKRYRLAVQAANIKKELDTILNPKTVAAPEFRQQPQPAAPGQQGTALQPGTILKQNGKRYRFKGGSTEDPANYEEL